MPFSENISKYRGKAWGYSLQTAQSDLFEPPAVPCYRHPKGVSFNYLKTAAVDRVDDIPFRGDVCVPEMGPGVGYRDPQEA